MNGSSRRSGPLGGGLWVAAGVFVPSSLVVVLSVATDQELGAAGLGRQSLIAFVSGSAATAAGAGGFVAIVRSVAAARSSGDAAAAVRVVRWGARLHTLTGMVAGAFVALAAVGGAEPRIAWLLAAVVTMLSTLQMVPMAVLVAAQQWRAAGVGMVTGAVGVAASIVVLRAGGGIAGLFAIEIAVVAVNVVWLAKLAGDVISQPGRADTAEHADAAEFEPSLRFVGLSAVGIIVTVVVWRRSELVILAWLSTGEEVARYSVAFAVSAILLALSERFAAALTAPFASLVRAGDDGRLRAAQSRAVRLLVVASLPLVGCTVALGPIAIRVLYGDEYARSGQVLVLMLATMPLLPVWSVSSAVLAAQGDATSPLLAGTLAAAIDVALSIPLVSAYGAFGAAGASVAGQSTAIALMHVMARRRAGPISWDVGSMVRSLVVACCAGIGAWSVATIVSGALGLVAGITTAVLGLPALSMLFRPLTMADAEWLAESRHGRRPRLGLALKRLARTGTGEGLHEPVKPATSA